MVCILQQMLGVMDLPLLLMVEDNWLVLAKIEAALLLLLLMLLAVADPEATSGDVSGYGYGYR